MTGCKRFFVFFKILCSFSIGVFIMYVGCVLSRSLFSLMLVPLNSLLSLKNVV